MASTQPATPTPQSDTGRSARRWTLVAMSLGFAVVQLDISVVNVAIKSIGSALGGGVSALQWVVNAYTIGFAAFILTAGALGDRIGARRVFVTGFVLFMIATLGWRAIFFINVPVALAGIYLSRRYATETSQSRDRGVDVGGQALAVLTLTALVAATIEGGARGFGSPLVLAGFALAAAAGAVFVAVEARGVSRCSRCACSRTGRSA